MSGKIPRVLQTRRLAQAAAKQAEGFAFTQPEAIRTTKLANGLTIVSYENFSPISKFEVSVRAGARFEPHNQLGLTHALRLAAGYTTKNSTIFGITRNLEYRGGQLTASTSRESIQYKLHNNRDNNEQTLGYLADTINKPAFKHWELEDFKYRFNVELERLDKDLQARLVEAVHKAAFAGSLGNSLYSPVYNVGKHTSDALHSYVKKYYQPNRTVIAASGVDHDALVKFIESNFEFGPVLTFDEPKSKFYSGDVRIGAAGSLAFTAVVGEGPSAQNLKESLAIEVFGHLIGFGSRIKYSSGNSRLVVAASKVAKHPFDVSTISAKYSETGLFGIHTITDVSDSANVIKAVVGELQKSARNITDAEVAKAKNNLINLKQQQYEDGQFFFDTVASNAFYGAQINSFDELISAIQQVSTKDVAGVAGKVIKNKFAVASVGNVANVPYAEELI